MSTRKRAVTKGIGFVLALILLSRGQGAQNQSQNVSGSRAHIEGVVLDAKTGAPVPAVILSGAGIVGTQMTDSQGRFSADINAGQQILNVSKMGYRPGRLEGRKLPGPTGIPLSLDSGSRELGLVIHLHPTSVVTGKVFDHRGQPAPNAAVQPYAYIYNEAGIRMRSNAPGGPARTNDLGNFRIDNLDPGEYFFEVRFEFPDLGGTVSSVLAPMFFPGTTDPDRAEPIQVDGGARLELKNITALAVRAGTLRIKLSNQGDEPRGTTIVSVFRRNETSATFRSTIVPKEAMSQPVDLGRFPPGPYFVRAGFAGVNGGTNEGRLFVDLGASDTEISVPIVTYPPWSVRGRAVLETGAGASEPLAGIQLAFYDVGPNVGSQFFRLQPPIILTSQQDGLLPGRAFNPLNPPYLFHVRVLNPPPDMYVVTIRGGSSTRELRPDYGRDTDLTVVLARGAGTLEGKVTDTAGKIVTFANVVLIPDDANEIHRLVTTTTTSTGSFRIQAGPGTYHVYAWRELIGAPYLNSEFMQEYVDRGLPVRIEPNGQATLNAVVLED